jgi:hypothetical protein
MHPFLANVINQFDDEATGSAAGALGLSRESFGVALATAAPAILDAIAGKAAQPEGAAGMMRTFSTLTSMGGSRPDTMLHGLLSDPRAMNAGANMARALLGPDFAGAVERLVSQAGLSEATAVQMLGVAAPVVLGAVGTQAKQAGIDAAGLRALLNDLMTPEAPAQPVAATPSEEATAQASEGSAAQAHDEAEGITDTIKRGLKKLFGRS